MVVDGLHRIRSFFSAIGISIFSTDRHHTFGIDYVHAIDSIIHQMNTPISHQSPSIIPEPAKIEMETIFIKWSFLCRTEPHIIVDAVRYRRVAFDRTRFHPALLRPYFVDADVSQQPLPSIFVSIIKISLTSLPLTDLEASIR